MTFAKCWPQHKLKIYPQIDPIHRTPFSSSTSPPILVLPIARRASSREYERLTFRGKLLTEMQTCAEIVIFIWEILVLGPRQNLNKCDFLQKSIIFLFFQDLGLRSPRSQQFLYFSRIWASTFLKVLCYGTRFLQGLFCFPKMTPRKSISMHVVFFNDFCQFL